MSKLSQSPVKTVNHAKGGPNAPSTFLGLFKLKLNSTAQELGRKQFVKLYFILPCILFSFIMGTFPLIFMVYLAFNSWQPGSGGITWVGFRNFENMLHDLRFLEALFHTVLIVVAAVMVELVLGTIVALFLQMRTWGDRWFRTIIVLPILLTPIALAYSWRMMFDYSHGPVNYFLGLAGVAPLQWLGNARMGMVSIVLVDVWQWTPFVALFLLAALESQDVELYDAARVDGANLTDMYRLIVLPLLGPFLFAMAMLRSIDTIKLFDTIYVLTGGGPGNSTESITLYNYVANFRTFNMGYMSAISVVLVIIVTIIFSFFMRGMSRVSQIATEEM